MCRFIRDTFQDPFIGLQVTLGITRLTVQAGLGNVALAKDKCTTQHNPLLAEGSTGRPTIILDDVALFIEYPYISSIILGGGPNVGIRAGLAVDAARLRGGPDWDVSNMKEMHAMLREARQRVVQPKRVSFPWFCSLICTYAPVVVHRTCRCVNEIELTGHSSITGRLLVTLGLAAGAHADRRDVP